ncbi:HSP70/90 family co-chaperone CNS1 [Aspergillus clavatus NRRL 1]|uniref:TPR repeat protein n=1 Tax=Aspergillus clavatus (strain ATCC 1007 / CBS 513.65 / DSM 816 / NCTC 3887 / NRRL 1 / QM 1276 / 107) TaxID=344612 RepID=A1CUK1_ASPCL|nr:TPR repeat protein [Aspergillus clavatus NRRL 1]EAW06988.1 TPR repeat protein [Aspergillus clavatus NRRL 1]
MGQVEELPDDFDESLNLNERPPATDAPPSQLYNEGPSPAAEETPFPINEERLKEIESNDPRAPKLPPTMASVRSNTGEDILKMMNKTPLFMTDINEAGDENGENPVLDALQAMQNEGTRGEVAQSYREQGNEAAREKRWIDAKEFYTKAIAVVTVKDNKWEKPEDPKEEEKLLRQVEEASYINRALCNLELKNYRSTTLDCASTLKLNPKNVKAYYRSSMALFSLDKLVEAEDAAARGLALDPDNKPLQQVAAKIADRKAALERIAAKKKAEEERVQKEKLLLSTALRARQIRTRKTAQPPDMDDAHIRLTPDPLSPESTLEFPTVLLYHMDAQTDFIKSFSEMSSIEDHLEYIFPLPWDEKHEYTINTVDCYMETVTGGLIKAGKKLPLLQILSGGKVEVVDELVKIYVIPTAKSAKFIAEMKARKEG